MTIKEAQRTHWIALDTMIRNEAEDIMDFEKRHKRKTTWAEAQGVARERIENWMKEASDEYRCKLNDPITLANFIASVRPAKAWATFMGLAEFKE